MDKTSHMSLETSEIPDAIQRLLDHSSLAVEKAAHAVRALSPHYISTLARGSSDHASLYFKYSAERMTRLPVASLALSTSSIHGVDLNAQGSVCISISQSGKSPDLLQMTEAMGRGGATTIGVTNTAASPLASMCDHTIDMQAGLEKSVAATKTFVCSIVSGLLLLGYWTQDRTLLDALHKLPAFTEKALTCDWSHLLPSLSNTKSLYTLGRGPSLAIAAEAALKFKEVCLIHGEAFSSAEVLHGPVSLAGSDLPVLSLTARDAAETSSAQTADIIAGYGSNVFATTSLVKTARKLPFIETGHPLTDPLILIVPFYRFVEQLAQSKGFDPDLPRHLKKVTQTL